MDTVLAPSPSASFSGGTKRLVSAEHFAFVDALRATAILLVVLSHILNVVPTLNSLKPMALSLGDLGVDAFFVLSGFLLGRPYIDALLRRRRMPNARLYARRRFLRIWPAYAVVVVIGAVLTHVQHHARHTSSIGDVATHLAMIHNFFPRYIEGAGNGAL